jgi:hypothetical protein
MPIIIGIIHACMHVRTNTQAGTRPHMYLKCQPFKHNTFSNISYCYIHTYIFMATKLAGITYYYVSMTRNSIQS